MNISGTVKFDLFRDIMQSLPKEIKKRVRREMKRAADVVVNNAKKRAPVDTGHLKGRIRSRQAAYSRDGLIYEIVSDAVNRVSSAGPYPSFQEFGWQTKDGIYHRGHPYFRAAVRESKPEVQRIITEAVNDALEWHNLVPVD